MSEYYFLEKETETGLYIGYNDETGKFRVVPSCHPYYMVKRIGNNDVECGNVECGMMFRSDEVESALAHYAISWRIAADWAEWGGAISVIRTWAAAWTGIPEDDLNIVLAAAAK